MGLSTAVGFPASCGAFIGSQSPSRVFEKGPIASGRFRIVAKAFERIVTPASSVAATVLDRNVLRATGSSAITDYEVDIEYLRPNFSVVPQISFSSLTPSVILHPSNRIASGVAPGKAVLKAESQDGEFAAISVEVKLTAGSSSDTLVSYVSGSAAKHCSDAIDTRIESKDASSKLIYSLQDHAAQSYVRNENCWLAGVNLTCVSPWNSTGGPTRAGTLISPRHVLFCEHLGFHPAVNASIRFVSESNATVTRTITGLATHPDYSPYYPDITVGVLDSDVPSSISFAKILPPGWASYFPSVGSNATAGATVPAVVIDQEEKALISEWRSADVLNVFVAPTSPSRNQFFEPIISGDSGSPAFIIINNDLVVLNTMTYGGPGAGTPVSSHSSAINSMMASLGGGYQLTPVDMSGFPSY